MTNNKAFLFFGTTGLEKVKALRQVADWAVNQGRPSPLIVDLEEEIEHLHGDGQLHQYLDQPNPSYQRKDWDDAFQKVARKVREARKRKDVYLAMHGVLLRRDYGVRSPIALENVASLKPDAIVTLIDDVFVNWHRTEARAASGQIQRGKPTLDQLLIGRRHEILIADQVVNFLEDRCGRPRIAHHVLALRHSLETLGRLLYQNNAQTVYVSFPITTPREDLQRGDSNTIEMVNTLLKEALEFQKQHSNLVLLLPVTMDEMLLKNLISTTASRSVQPETLRLSLSSRWSIPVVLGPALRCEAALPASIEIPTKQVEAVAGLIDEEIRTHDFRMIDQSQKVLVLSQYCKGHKSDGVSAEIDYAKVSLRKVELYQEPSWLPDGVSFGPPSGSGPFLGGDGPT